jgi:NAD(P)-dependent dehydrogenase (short-subunit alcohol dehydrogenase family)
MKLTGKKALITGGNSGIGLATARLFVAEGAEVAITGRDQKTLDEAVAELGPNARGYRADVTVADDRKRLFADLAKDFGKLDIVFVNAGISGRTPTGSTDEAIVENVTRTRIFISYRQKDTIAIAGRIFDRLKAHFGQDNVFMDVDGNNQIVQGDRS